MTLNLKTLAFLLTLLSASPTFAKLNANTLNNVSEKLETVTSNADFNKIALERVAWFRTIIEKYAKPTKYISPNLVHALIAHESRGDLTAQSPTGPKGLGQFTKRTGKAYDLDQTIKTIRRLAKKGKKQVYVPMTITVEDERLDPDEAIRAICDHLEDLFVRYSEYDDYAKFFALAAYNQGEGVVNYAIKTAKRKGLEITWDNVSKFLPKEAQDYSPYILAKKTILDNPKTFPKLQIPKESVGLYDKLRSLSEFKRTNGLSIKDFAKRFGYNLEHLQLLNPELNINAALLKTKILVPNKKSIELFKKYFRPFDRLQWDEFGFGKTSKRFDPVQVKLEILRKSLERKQLSKPKIIRPLTKPTITKSKIKRK